MRTRAGSAHRGLRRGTRRGRDAGAHSNAFEAGFSLVEICITVVILGLAFTALLGSMATATSTSDRMARHAQADSHGRQLAELLRGGEIQLTSCAAGTTLADAYQGALASAPALAGFDFDVTDARWTDDPTANEPLAWSANCWVSPRPRLEWVQIKVTAVGRDSVSVTVAVMLRNEATS